MIFLLVVVASVYFYVKKIFNYFLISILFFITSGFQLMPISVFKLGFNINKPLDYLLIILFIIIVFDLKKVLTVLLTDSVGKLIGIFLFAIIIYSFYTNFYFDVGWDKILRASRNYFLLAYYFVFIQFKINSLVKGVDMILTITGFLCIIYIIQFIIGNTLLYSTVDEEFTTIYSSKLGNFTRYYNAPIFHLIAYLILLKRMFQPNKSKKDILIFSLVCITILLTFSRSILTISLFFLIITYYLSVKKTSFGQLMVILVFILPFSNILFDVLESTINTSANAFKYINNNDSNTFAFRISHFYERFNYLLNGNDVFVKLFGYGFVTEDTQIVQRFHFQVGLVNKFDLVNQIDTADIVWSRLIIYFGILGTILFVLFFYKIYSFQKINYVYRLEVKYILLFGLLTSFTTIMIIENHTLIGIVYLCSANYVAMKKSKYKQINQLIIQNK